MTFVMGPSDFSQELRNVPVYDFRRLARFLLTETPIEPVAWAVIKVISPHDSTHSVQSIDRSILSCRLVSYKVMKILINDHLEIGTLQKQFNEEFPCLKICFFKPEVANDHVFNKSNMVEDKTVKVAELTSRHYAGYWNIRPGQKTGELEAECAKTFGLYIQVFRRSGNSWLETGNSDGLTLEEQNKKGIDSTLRPDREALPDMDQYHEQI
jgi:hypothetical protein